MNKQPIIAGVVGVTVGLGVDCNIIGRVAAVLGLEVIEADTVRTTEITILLAEWKRSGEMEKKSY